MPHLTHKKITSSHTTVIDAAVPVVKTAVGHADVTKVVLGMIRQCSGRAGRRRVKCVSDGAVLKVTVRGSTSAQEIWLYTKETEAVRLALDKLFKE